MYSVHWKIDQWERRKAGKLEQKCGGYRIRSTGTGRKKIMLDPVRTRLKLWMPECPNADTGGIGIGVDAKLRSNVGKKILSVHIICNAVPYIFHVKIL
jgi:hypothetical protein